MADLVEVADALVGFAAAALYPAGIAQPSATGDAVRLYQGWPNPKQLEDDLAAGMVHVSVWPRPGDRNTTRYLGDWTEVSRSAPTITAVVSGATVTFGGSVVPPQAVALLVDGKGYSYGVQAGDTLSTIAVALAALIGADRPASAAGSVLSVPGARAITARIVVAGTSAREWRRQERVFQVTTWASRFDRRDAVARLVDQTLAALYRFPLPDGTVALMRYAGSGQDDDTQKQRVYRRDLLYSVEYPTLESRTDYTVAIQTINVSGGPRLDAQGPIRAINL